MLKMTAEGGNVDAANCAARYTPLSKTADHHGTFCSPLTLSWSGKQFCKSAK